MNRTGPVLPQGRQMFGRAVTLVALEAIVRITLASSSMPASRCVLARIEAADISATVASPPTMARIGKASAGQRLPSISTSAGVSDKPATARCIASRVACRMLMASISSTVASAIAQASAFSRISMASRSRRAAESFFESARPTIGRAGSRITAAATTGPASGPRPASSTPQIMPEPMTEAAIPRQQLSRRCSGAIAGACR